MPPDLDFYTRYRAEFPVTHSLIYMNHAAISPVSRRVERAMAGVIEDVCRFGALHYDHWESAVDAARRSVASLINAAPDEIAFMKNTSEGISSLALGLEWGKGDEVVSIEGEFPANVYAWKSLERQGVRIRLVAQPKGEVSLEAIERAMSRRTKVVAVSFVQFLSGYRLDLASLGRLCQGRNVLLFVDGIQGLGAFPVDVKAAGIAGLAGAAYKWLLGPEGCGILFVRRDVLDRLTPRSFGWTSVEGWQEFSARELVLRKDTARFEVGTPNRAGIYGIHAAIGLLREAGIERIASRVLDLTDRLRHGLVQLGHEVYGPVEREHCSGIVSFAPSHGTAENVRQRLERERVIVSARHGRVRVSPHFYNSEAEIDRVLELLAPNVA